MPDENDILLDLYKQNYDLAFHYQNQRATSTNIILTISAGIVGLITFDQKLEGTDFYAALVLVIVGCYGAILSAKQYERFAFYRERARVYREKLDSLFPKASILESKSVADERSRKRFRLLRHVYIRHLWLILNLFIVLIGVWLAIKCKSGS
jgi:hypothetical protein